MTTVVNVSVKHLRKRDPPIDNIQEWMEDPNHVYIGRRLRIFITDPVTKVKTIYQLNTSIWANPFQIDDDNTREDVLAQYRKYMVKRLETEPGLIEKLLLLEGCDLAHNLHQRSVVELGCWCHPASCHGDVLIELIEEYSA